MILRLRWTVNRTDHLTSGRLNLVVEIVHELLHGCRHGFADFFTALKSLYALAKFRNLGGHGCQGLGKRIVDLLGIGDDDALAFTENDVAGDANDRGVVRNVAQHDRASAYAAVLTDGDIAENLRSAADYDIFFQSGMPFAVLLAGAPESDTLVERNVIADDRRFSDDHAHPMIDEDATPNSSSRVNLDAGQPSCNLREPSRRQKEAVVPKPVVHAEEPHRVQARVTQ